MQEVEAAARAAGRPRPLFVHPASVEAGDRFFAAVAPGARAVADPDLELYRAFGLSKGSLVQLLGPRVWAAGLRALLHGHRPRTPAGSTRAMPGVFLVENGAIRWSHRGRHAGDHPDARAMARALDAVTSGAGSHDDD